MNITDHRLALKNVWIFEVKLGDGYLTWASYLPSEHIPRDLGGKAELLWGEPTTYQYEGYFKLIPCSSQQSLGNIKCPPLFDYLGTGGDVFLDSPKEDLNVVFREVGNEFFEGDFGRYQLQFVDDFDETAWALSLEIGSPFKAVTEPDFLKKRFQYRTAAPVVAYAKAKGVPADFLAALPKVPWERSMVVDGLRDVPGLPNDFCKKLCNWMLVLEYTLWDAKSSDKRVVKVPILTKEGVDFFNKMSNKPLKPGTDRWWFGQEPIYRAPGHTETYFDPTWRRTSGKKGDEAINEALRAITKPGS